MKSVLFALLILFCSGFSLATESIEYLENSSEEIEQLVVKDDTIFSDERQSTDVFRTTALKKIKRVKHKNSLARQKIQRLYEVERKEREVGKLRIENNDRRAVAYKLQNNLLVTGFWIVIASVIIALIVFYRWRFEHEKRSLQVRRATFAAREQEKLRFSRELHDDFQSTLSIIHMMASHEHTKSPDNNHFEELKNSAKNAMREIRKMSEVLYPSEINTEGLFESLKSLIKRKNDSNSSVFFHLSAKYFDCDKALQLVIYRSVEDLIEETVKFSRAKEVYVAVNLIKKRIELCYTEKGNDIIREELDFQIIHERISALGGKLIVVRVHSNLSEIKVIYIV